MAFGWGVLKWIFGVQSSCYSLNDGLSGKQDSWGMRGKKLNNCGMLLAGAEENSSDAPEAEICSHLQNRTFSCWNTGTEEQHRKCAHMKGVSSNSIDCPCMTSLQPPAGPGGEQSITELLSARLVLNWQNFHQSFHPEAWAPTGTSTHVQLFQPNFAFGMEIKH